MASLLVLAALCAPQPAAAQQYVQQGPKLVGTPILGQLAKQGKSVALSADGNTALVGGPSDNNLFGAAWVFIRSGGVWTQQSKLIGTGAVGSFIEQGFSVSLSADGNTAIVGGPLDGSNTGAAWVFTRSGGVWAQQGSKLVGTGAVGAAQQGTSVALSADGNTAVVGGPADNGNTGATWVYTRSGGVWTQQGSKLVGTGAVGTALQGTSVALSSDGNTVIVGGPCDNPGSNCANFVGVGAAWVFTRSGGVWTQQGAKLVGTGVTSPFGSTQGTSVALSADGNTAVVGGPNDSATWVFTRSGGVWTQQGAKLFGTGGGVDAFRQGTSVALSADGNTAVVGGPGGPSDGAIGATWVFTRTDGVWTQHGLKLVGTGSAGGTMQGSGVAVSGDHRTILSGGPGDTVSPAGTLGATWVFVVGAAHDFNGDNRSDIAWRDASGDAALWEMTGTKLAAGPVFGPVPTAWSMAGQRDFNGDGMSDWLWLDTDGNVAIWLLSGFQVLQFGSVGTIPTSWAIVGTADFNDDGRGDILFRDASTGTVAIWLMNGFAIQGIGAIGLASNWVIVGTADFDGDGKGDILLRDTGSGTVAVWLMSGLNVRQIGALGAVASNWVIAGTGDFDNDGKGDILWRETTTGTVAIWFMDGLTVRQIGAVAAATSNWVIQQTGDYNGDGISDILWRETTTGTVSMWFMNGLAIQQIGNVGAVAMTWTIQGANAD
jgi:hypothetical protein